MLTIVTVVEPLLLVVTTCEYFKVSIHCSSADKQIAVIICTRVYAVWGNHRTAFWVLSACWAVHLVVDIIVVCVFGALGICKQLSLGLQTLRLTGPAHARYLPEYNLCAIDVHYGWVTLLNSIILHTILACILIWIWFSTPR